MQSPPLDLVGIYCTCCRCLMIIRKPLGPMRYCVVAGAILQWSHAPRLRISRGCSRGWSGPTLERRPYCVATARPRKQDEKEGIMRKKAREQPPATYFSRGELAKATYQAGLICVFFSRKAVRGKKREPVTMFSSRSARQQLEHARLSSRMSLARLLESHRVELFHFQLQDPAGSTQGCGLCDALPWPPSWNTRTGWSQCVRASACLGQLSNSPSP